MGGWHTPTVPLTSPTHAPSSRPTKQNFSFRNSYFSSLFTHTSSLESHQLRSFSDFPHHTKRSPQIPLWAYVPKRSNAAKAHQKRQTKRTAVGTKLNNGCRWSLVGIPCVSQPNHSSQLTCSRVVLRRGAGIRIHSPVSRFNGMEFIFFFLQRIFSR